jgi:phosphoribosylglycinamide formyltransferase 1
MVVTARSDRPAPVRVAVLASGAGSNMVALAEAIEQGRVAAEIVAVLSDVPDAPVLARAQSLGIPARAVAFDRADRAAWETRLGDAVMEAGAEVVVLAGFMRILSGAFLSRWPDRVVNVHPSLLPAFRGADAVGDALAAGVRVTGVTVHLVDELVDHGPILLQEAVSLLPGDDRGALLERLHEVEHRLLPLAVDLLARGLVRVAGGRATILAAPSTPPTDPAVPSAARNDHGSTP